MPQHFDVPNLAVDPQTSAQAGTASSSSSSIHSSSSITYCGYQLPSLLYILLLLTVVEGEGEGGGQQKAWG